MIATRVKLGEVTTVYIYIYIFHPSQFFKMLTGVVLTEYTPCKSKIVKKGCYKDDKKSLKNLLQNFRSNINWGNGWNNFLHETACR